MKLSLLVIAPLLSCALDAQIIPANLLSETGVAYAQADPQQVMDIVRPRESGRRPAIVAIHGGRPHVFEPQLAKWGNLDLSPPAADKSDCPASTF